MKSYFAFGKYTERGFCGHEHVSRFINMNARLYDPTVGRFMSPDPYVQAPDFTQNLNRYSYALNNPLKYTDPSGEFFIFMAFNAIGDLMRNLWKHGFNVGQYNWKKTRNSFRLELGMFQGNILQVLNKWTYSFLPSAFGNLTAQSLNVLGKVERVTEMDGMLAIAGVTSSAESEKRNGPSSKAFTIGHYSMGPHNYVADWHDNVFVHEYGHYIQAQRLGSLYFRVIAIPSLMSAAFTDNHTEHWMEKSASRLGNKHFSRYSMLDENGKNIKDERFYNPDVFTGSTSYNYYNPRLNKEGQVRTFPL